MVWSCPLRFVATLHFQKHVVYRRLQHAMSHAGLFGSWHLARGEAEECYGLGCSAWEMHPAVADGVRASVAFWASNLLSRMSQSGREPSDSPLRSGRSARTAEFNGAGLAGVRQRVISTPCRRSRGSALRHGIIGWNSASWCNPQ